MKAALILAAVGAVVAQDLSGIPGCATGCLSTAITKAGCNPTDQACQCGPTSASIGSFALDCLLASCNAQQLATVQSVGSELCVEYSASLTAHSTTGGSTAASTTASVGSTGSTVASSTTSSAAVSTSASASESSSAAAATVTSTSVVGSNSTVTSHSPTAQSTNAAAAPVFVGVGALAAFLGAVAAL